MTLHSIAFLESAGAHVFGDTICLDLRYDQELVTAVRRLGGRFDARRKRWIVSNSRAQELVQLLQSDQLGDAK